MAFHNLLLFALAILFIFQPCYSSWTVSKDDENRAVARILQLITASSYQNRVIRNPAAKLVRLSFHDCVGGCDGCLNIENSNNNGLEDIFSIMNNIYDNEGYRATGMSRADFYALAGIVAIRHAADQQSCDELGLPRNCTKPVPTMFIRYGRLDCSTSPNTRNFYEFPNAHGDLSHVFDIFQDQMNMTMRQIVAIIGAHSLGDAGPNRTGFRGPWAPPTNRFDNGFFRLLQNPNNIWFQQVLNSRDEPLYQWVRYENGKMPPPNANPPPPMMLNTDMALFRDIKPNNTGLESDMNCRLNVSRCMLSSTAKYVIEFAENNTAFHEAFGPAYQILLQNGYDDNELFAATLLTGTGGAEKSQGVLFIVIITAFMAMIALLI